MLNERSIEGCAALAQAGNNLVVQHADSTVSVMTFDRVDKLTTDRAAKEIADMKLEPEAQGKFYYFVIRDLYNRQILVAKPDGCYRYHIVDYSEAPSKGVLRELDRLNHTEENKDDTQATVINSRYPVIAYWEGTRIIGMSVKIPATRFFYDNDMLRIKLPITLPPLVYKLKVYKASLAPEHSSVCILAQDSLDTDAIQLARLPMPNVFPDGGICVGDVHRAVGKSPKSLSEALDISFDMFINSTWNTDLLYSDIQPSNLEVVYNEAGGDEKCKELGIFVADPYHFHRKLITVLSDPEGWKKLDWHRYNAPDFRRNFGL